MLIVLGELKDRIQRTGLKKKVIAERIGVNVTTFSSFLSGERSLESEKIIALEQLLKKADKIHEILL